MEIQKIFKEFCEWLASASDEELEAAIKEARTNFFFKDEYEEIIHCKDCEYFNPLHGSCYLVMGTNGENFYCAAGKRKEQTPKIVWCKDCEHYYKEQGSCDLHDERGPDGEIEHRFYVTPDWFCADGENKND